MNAWTTFWTWANENQLAATIIGGVIAGLMLAGLLRLLSHVPKIGPHAQRLSRWLWAWRPLTHRRFDREKAELLSQASAHADDAEKSAGERIAEVTEGLEARLSQVESLARRVEQGLGDVSGRIDEVPSANLLEASDQASPRRYLAPRWRVQYDEGDRLFTHTYKLTNLVPDSAAYRVRLENAPRSGGLFEFKSAAAWADLSGEREVTFTGETMKTDVNNQFLLQLEWFDENDNYFQRDILLRGPKQWDSQDPNDLPF